MKRVIYPAKAIRSKDIGDFRAIVTRQQHEHGVAPTYAIAVWDDYTCLTRDHHLDLDAANQKFEEVLSKLYVEMAKRAFGHTPNVESLLLPE